MEYLTWVDYKHKRGVVAAGYVSILILGAVDYLTGPEIALSVFYVLPISLVTWVSNRRLGLGASFFSAAVWLAADLTGNHQYASPLIPYWNSIIRLSFFLIITFLLASLKNLLELAHTDHLTSAMNSRYFYEVLQVELNRIQRSQRPFTMAYLDLDNFKAINDRFGHVVGDQALIALVNSVKNMIRKSDVIARLGGDEFAILFPETGRDGAHIILDKIEDSVTDVMQQRDLPITFSVGVLTCTAAPGTPSELVKMVDNLMYEAKAGGKNTVRYSTYDG